MYLLIFYNCFTRVIIIGFIFLFFNSLYNFKIYIIFFHIFFFNSFKKKKKKGNKQTHTHNILANFHNPVVSYLQGFSSAFSKFNIVKTSFLSTKIQHPISMFTSVLSSFHTSTPQHPPPAPSSTQQSKSHFVFAFWTVRKSWKQYGCTPQSAQRPLAIVRRTSLAPLCKSNLSIKSHYYKHCLCGFRL